MTPRDADVPLEAPDAEISVFLPAPPATPEAGPGMRQLLSDTPAGSIAPPLPPAVLSRPFATARCLPGFMQADSVARHLPLLAGLPASTVASIQQRIGAAAVLDPVANAGRPSFGRVTEPGVLALLEQVVQSSTPATPDNLIGFEWVEIAPLVAGRLVTEAEPLPESMPEPLDALGVARVCLFSYGKLPAANISPRGAPQITVPAHADLVHAGHQPLRINQNGVEQVLLVAQYVVQPLVQPVRVLVVDGRAVALSGLARLVALRRRGIEHALCAVSFGYGHDSFLAPPTVDTGALAGPRPPLISDFDDDRVAVAIPVRAEMTVMTLATQTLRT